MHLYLTLDGFRKGGRWSWRRLLPTKEAPSLESVSEFMYSSLTKRTNIRLLWLEPGRNRESIELSLFESLFPPPRATQGDAIQRPLQDDIPGLPRETFAFESVFSPAAQTDTIGRPRQDGTLGLPRENYYALSYVWGDATQKRRILVNHTAFDITKNLHQFLVAARHPRERRGPYWIDAICINQRDNVEKSTQISMMGEIYKSTLEAIVWLGEGKDDSDMAYDLLGLMEQEVLIRYEYKRRENPQWPVNSDGSTDLRTVTTYLGDEQEDMRQRLLHCMDINFLSPPRYHKRAWRAMFKLWCRPWFQRLWTVQEFILPPKASFLCGERRLPAKTIIICLHALMALWVSDQKRFGLNDEAEKAMRGFRSAVRGRLAFQEYKEEPYDLILALKDNRHRQATESKDKVFGLTGIVSDRIMIEYEKPAREVYVNVAVHYIHRGRYWDVFSAAGWPRSIPNLPTWVPDWSIGALPEPAELDPDMYHGVFGTIFPHLESEQQRPRVSADFRSVFCFGLAVAVVKDTMDPPSRLLTPPETQQIIDRWMSDRVAHFEAAIASGTYVLPQRFRDYNHLLTERIQRAQFADVASHNTTMSRVDTLSAEEYSKATAKDYSGGRVFFITINRGLFGLAPLGSRSGDLLVFLKCAKIPFILRPRYEEGCCEMIGPCYGEFHEPVQEARC